MNPIEIRFKLNGKVSDITPEIHAEKQGCVHYQYSYKGKIIAETIIDDRNTFIFSSSPHFFLCLALHGFPYFTGKKNSFNFIPG